MRGSARPGASARRSARARATRRRTLPAVASREACTPLMAAEHTGCFVVITAPSLRAMDAGLLALVAGFGGAWLGNAYAGGSWLREKRLAAYHEFLEAMSEVARRFDVEPPRANSLNELEAKDEDFARLDRARLIAMLLLPPRLIWIVDVTMDLTELTATRRGIDPDEYSKFVTLAGDFLSTDLRTQSSLFAWRNFYHPRWISREREELERIIARYKELPAWNPDDSDG